MGGEQWALAHEIGGLLFSWVISSLARTISSRVRVIVITCSMVLDRPCARSSGFHLLGLDEPGMKRFFSRRDLPQEAAAGLQGPDVTHTGTGVRVASPRPSPAVEAGNISARRLGHLHPAIGFLVILRH